MELINKNPLPKLSKDLIEKFNSNFKSYFFRWFSEKMMAQNFIIKGLFLRSFVTINH